MRSVALVAMIVMLGLSVFAKPLGSLVLDRVDPTVDPTVGSDISFTVKVDGLPTNGGASTSPWVETSCGDVYDRLEPANEMVDPSDPTLSRARFTLTSAAWATAGYAPQECDAYLFLDTWQGVTYDADGWHGPRRRKANTLAAVFFLATAP